MKKIPSFTLKEFIFLVLFFIIWRFGLFILGGTADYFLRYNPSFPFYDNVLVLQNVPRWLYSWANFDGVYYVIIAEKGYVGTGLVQAFFPLLPYVLMHTLK